MRLIVVAGAILLLALLATPTNADATSANPATNTPNADPDESKGAAHVFSVKYADCELRLTPITANIVRVQVIPVGAREDFARVSLLAPLPNRTRFSVQDSGDFIELTTPTLRARVHKDTARVDFFDAKKETPLSLDGEGVSCVDGKMRAVRAITPDEEFFGFGLQFHSFAQRGKTKTLKVNADAKTDIGSAHAVVPFFLSTAGYGIFLNSHAYTHFDLGKARSDRLAFDTPDPILDYFFCYGPSFHDLLTRYTRLTGRMAMPPKWGLGFWYRMRQDWDADKVNEVAASFRERGIPCDVIGLEPKWQTHAYSCSYLWNHALFPDPKAFVAGLSAQHFHLNLWEHAYVHPTSPIHDELKRENLVADKEVWGGYVPDFTKPETGRIFESLHLKEHIDLGVSGYKLDECDGSDFTGGWFFPDDTKFPSGLTGAQMHNVFGLLYQKTFHAMFEKRNQRTYLLCRGMFAGAQAYPSVIYSDLYGFPEYLRAAANSGFSGVLWCPEVRQTENREEFVRRLQAVFFSPLAMINAWADGVTPWEKGPEIEAIFRSYAALRMQLTPYLYSAFWQMHLTGLPVVRALVMDWPNDRNTYTVDDAFLYGDSLLVAPILSGEQRAIYLPKGQWTDWWTGETLQGGTTISYHAPLGRLPLFVRAGAIVPMQPATRYADEKPADTLMARVYPGKSQVNYTLYDDDGKTLDYRAGKRFEGRLEYIPEGPNFALKIGPSKGKYRPVWKSALWETYSVNEAPSRILYGSVPVRQVSSETLGAAKLGYFYDSVTRVLHIKTPFVSNRTITVLR